MLVAFDLLELNGKDLRHAPLEERREQLAELLLAAVLAPFAFLRASRTDPRC